jgi:hypothetical protein
MATIDKSRHAFGQSSNLENAMSNNLIDAYDILFLDGDTDPKIGWVDAKGVVRMVDTDCVVVVEGEELPETGEIGKVYIFKDEGYFWNGIEFKPMAKSADLSALEAKIDSKVDAVTVDTMIKDAVAEASGFEIVEF